MFDHHPSVFLQVASARYPGVGARMTPAQPRPLKRARHVADLPYLQPQRDKRARGVYGLAGSD
jgi:hypothetical protein